MLPHQSSSANEASHRKRVDVEIGTLSTASIRTTKNNVCGSR
jgi:hypothetical protein